MSNVIEIKSGKGELLALVIKARFSKKGVNYFSDAQEPLQVAVSSYSKGEAIQGHFHRSRRITVEKIQEFIHVDRGMVIVDIYETGHKTPVKSIKLVTGDSIYFIKCGHGFRFEKATKIIESIQGPYIGKKKTKDII